MRTELKERYVFDWKRIQNEDNYHIEYSITDKCNRNCGYCSHLAPLAKNANFVTEQEFGRVVNIMHRLVPDAHTFWLTGGEPTLHPKFMRLLEIACEIFESSNVGIYSNGMTLSKYEGDQAFWQTVKNSGIVWGITCYDRTREYFENMFARHGCLNNLAILHGGRKFFNLVNYSSGQPVSQEKYIKCGWERSKINIRGGKIYNCPSAEFSELFNGYFGERLTLTDKDYLVIDDNLTREQIDAFRGPIPFCGQCDLTKRCKKITDCAPSKKQIGEWSCFE